MCRRTALLAVTAIACVACAQAAWKMEETLSREDYETDGRRDGSPELFSAIVAPGLLVQTRMAAYRAGDANTIEKTDGAAMPDDPRKAFARGFRIYSFGRKERVSSKLETRFLFGPDQPFVFSVEQSAESRNIVCSALQKRLEVPIASLPADFLFTANRLGEGELTVRGLGDSSSYSMKFPASRFEYSAMRPVSVVTTFESREPGREAEIVLDELRTGIAVRETRTVFPSAISPTQEFDPDRAGWRKILDDDFDGMELDPEKWTVRDGDPSLVRVGGGELRIGCDWRKGTAERVSTNLCSATLRSRKAYRFGYFEARVKFTRQNGWWAAFWLYGLKNTNPVTEGFEIDIFEDFYTRRRDAQGRLMDKIDHNLHLYCGSSSALKSWNYNSDIPGSPDGWHDVGCKWTPFEISIYIDGRLVSSRAWHSPWESVTFDAFSHGAGTAPLHVMLSGEVMRSQWNSDTQDVTGCVFPDWYRIDRVRVWEYPETGDRAPRVSWAHGTAADIEAETGRELVFRADVEPAAATKSPVKAVYLFDTGYPMQCLTNFPGEFRVVFDETHYRATRYMEPGRQDRRPSFDVPHYFQLFAQDAAGAVGFSDPVVVKPVPPRPVEPPMAFQKRLLEVHKRDMRDFSLKPDADEFVFRDGCVVPTEDFADFLSTSMGVKSKVSAKGGVGGIVMRYSEKLREREYAIAVATNGVAILARDARAGAQALYHLEDLMSLRRAPFLKTGRKRRRGIFERRITHSGYGCDMFPDGHLASLAHAGFDTILFYIYGIDRVDGATVDVADVIDRAAKWGLDSYLYSSLSAPSHPDDPASDAEMARTYGAVARKYRNAKGFLIVPESCPFESRDPRVRSKTRKTDASGRPLPDPGRFPCSDYPKWLAKVERTIRAEIPDADIVFWTYNFFWTPERDRFAFIDGVTPTTVLNVTFALGPGDEHRTRLGMSAPMSDYSICEPGPSAIFRAEAAHIRERGLRLFTTSNTGGRTWDFGGCPYEPVPQQWKRRFDAMLSARKEWGLSGLIESHHYGFVPNFVGELAKEAFTEGGMPFGEHLRKIAARDFGARHADETVAVWADVSEAIRDYVATSRNQYGPFRAGPAYPFNALGPFLEKGDKDGWPGFDSWICNPNYGWSIPWGGGKGEREPLDAGRQGAEAVLFAEAGKRFVDGGAKLRAFADELRGERRARARREAGVVEYIGRSFLTASNVIAAELAARRHDSARASEEEKSAAKAEILRLARAEYENASAALPLVEEDSLLGWECRNKYIGGRERIAWKLRRMERQYEIALHLRQREDEGL